MTNADTSELIMRGIRFKRDYVLGFGWSRKKGDWWWQDSPDNATFFDIRKQDKPDLVRYGIYIGRLALVFMVRKQTKQEFPLEY